MLDAKNTSAEAYWTVTKNLNFNPNARLHLVSLYNVIRRTTDLCCAFLYLELATGWKAGSGFHSALGRLATLKNV